MSISLVCLPAGDGHREGCHGPQCIHEVTEACARAGAGKKEAADQPRESRGTEQTQGMCICHVFSAFILFSQLPQNNTKARKYFNNKI